jgi:acetate kinase
MSNSHKILVVNCGGATFKYKLIAMPDERVLASGHVDRLATGKPGVLQHRAGENEVREEREIPDHRAAIEWMCAQLLDSNAGVLQSLNELDVIGHKMAHDGMKLGLSGVLDENAIQTLRDMIPLAPVHNPPSLVGYEIFRELLPQTLQTASFETGFHCTVAPEHFTYGLPLAWRDDYGVRRYGFHSCSHRFVSSRCAELMHQPDAKIVLCHLGSGSSVAAVHAGKSVNISSGLTPQCGTMMSTRPGDYDAGAVNYISRLLDISRDEYDRIETKESGLKGISGVASGDMRDVEEAMNQGNERAQLAFDVFCEKVRHYIGAYLVQMNGLDAITFTGGIGENSVAVRARVCKNLEAIGAKLDDAKNAQGADERSIHAQDSRVQIWIIPTDEELIVARDAMEFLGVESRG